jgi:membrane associated rhomboid family serine protease
MSLICTLKDRRVLLASLVFLGVNLLAMIGFGKFGATGAIAWEAHIGGYVFGLCAFSAFDSATQNNHPPAPQLD